jgi:hypothetical protein
MVLDIHRHDMELDTKEILSLKKELYEIISESWSKHMIKFIKIVIETIG